MNQQALDAIKAAKGFYTWGAYAARRFAQKNNVHPALLRLARQLENEARSML